MWKMGQYLMTFGKRTIIYDHDLLTMAYKEIDYHALLYYLLNAHARNGLKTTQVMTHTSVSWNSVCTYSATCIKLLNTQPSSIPAAQSALHLTPAASISCVATDRMRLWISGLSLRDRMRSSDIQKQLRAESLLLHVERSQLKCFRHLVRIPPGHLPFGGCFF